MKHITKYLTVIIVFISIGVVSCTRHRDCFDQQLYDQHKNDICTMDCPGVRGCDGKSYCNECIANTQGIRVK